ncbi:MAG: helix-turn-helix domain-containing protein [Planctomycetes bacterium]|nr:helix-turn-helix domain-containing protein [Planctomycetota bacterium]
MRLDDLKLLECLAEADAPLGFAALAAQTRVAPATLTRMLNRLAAWGYAAKVAHGSYEAGPGLLALGARVQEHSAALPFRALLGELADETGQNAEVYALTPNGPVFLQSAPGRSEIRITLRPGHLVKSVAVHPGGLFSFARYPDGVPAVAEDLKRRGLSRAAFRTRVRKAEEARFYADRGQIRPELARAGVSTRDGRFCVCVSGGVSEFPAAKDEALRKKLLAALQRMEGPHGLKKAKET